MSADVRLGDCLAVMPTLAAGSVHLVLCDLPYGTTANKWDAAIPFAPLWAEYRRILAPRGAVVLTASQPFTSALVASNPAWFKYALVWRKNRLTNFYNTPYQPGKAHEDIIVFSPAAASFSRAGTMTYNPQMAPGAEWTKRDTGRENAHIFHSAKRAGERRSAGRHPLSVIDCPVVQRTVHPTEKPVPLLAYLIRTYSNPGETVLDNCAGSGSTGVACVQTGRRFIGIEREPEYVEIARRRIADADAQGALEGIA